MSQPGSGPEHDARATLHSTAGPFLAEYHELEERLADPSTHSDVALTRRLGRRYAELTGIVTTYGEWLSAVQDVRTAQEFLTEDPSFADELTDLTRTERELAGRLRLLLVPRDPDDDRDVIMEIKAGEGGEESALFAADLLRMYLRYVERRGWRAEILQATDSDLGGLKDASVAVKSTRGTPGEGVYARLKFEGGVHRVQRIPVTESAGRIHTSAAGVLVLPEVEEVDITIDPEDLRIDVFRSSGPGGQSVNTTDSAIRITHLPTGLVASCQNEKSQLQNKEQALRILRARLHAVARQNAQELASAVRRSQVRTVDRSERIRTYNFPENRITDHRTGYKAYNLDQVLDGDLEPVVASCLAVEQTERLAAVRTSSAAHVRNTPDGRP